MVQLEKSDTCLRCIRKQQLILGWGRTIQVTSGWRKKQIFAFRLCESKYERLGNKCHYVQMVMEDTLLSDLPYCGDYRECRKQKWKGQWSLWASFPRKAEMVTLCSAKDKGQMGNVFPSLWCEVVVLWLFPGTLQRAEFFLDFKKWFYKGEDTNSGNHLFLRVKPQITFSVAQYAPLLFCFVLFFCFNMVGLFSEIL